MNAQLAGNMPYLATLPSCVLYLRPFGTASGGTTFKDWSPQKLTVTYGGTTPVNSTAKTGIVNSFPPASIYFAGNGYLSASNSARLCPTTGYKYVISLWVWMGAPGTNAYEIFGTRTSNTNTTIGWNIVTGYISNGISFIATTSSGTWVSINSSVNFPASQWNSLILTIDASNNVVLYQNGVSVATGTGSGQIYNTGNTAYIGYYPTGYTGYPTMYVDEVAIFDGYLGTVPTPGDIYKSGVGQTRRLIV